MLDSKIASEVIAQAIELGADFCDIFIEQNDLLSLSVNDSKLHEIKSGTDFGVGVRVIFGTKALYGHTNNPTKNELIRITKTLCHVDRKNPSLSFEGNFSPTQVSNIHPFSFGLESDKTVEERVQFLMKVDRAARSCSELIKQVSIGAFQREQRVQIFNSEGLEASDTRRYVRITNSTVAQDGELQSDGFFGPGASAGWEFIESLDPTEMGERVAKQALVTLKAKPCPGGKMPVVIDNGFGGVIFHEACGHLLETTSVEKQASVFWDKMGENIAHESVSAVDDGTIPGAWGSLNIDDEGMPTKKTQLIKNGKLTSFMVDRLGEMKTGHQRTGSGRRESYRYAPASRMRNTYIEAGEKTLDQLFEGVSEGIYAKEMGGGSVMPGTGQFNFAVKEAYMIRDGKLAEPVRGATLIGTGPDVLTKISAVGNNFLLGTGMCGSVSGSIPASVGQACIKVDEILVGGQ